MQVTTQIDFCAGHRIIGHEGKSQHFHGHNYMAQITLEGDELDKLERLVDIEDVKRQVEEWVDQHWDHAMILDENDETETEMPFGAIGWIDGNPTVENMAKRLANVVHNLFPGFGVEVILWVTPRICATVRRGIVG